jgi:putative (di)nucleoside polyphosphate hydrolase
MKSSIYRQGVNAFVIDSNKRFLLVQRINYKNNEWDFPGGGVEDGDTPKTAILRELEEEFGSKDFKILHKSPITHKFDWSEETQDMYFEKRGKKYKGQEKFQFIIKFTGEKERLSLQKEEIKKIKWVSYKDLKDHLVFDGQWENSKKVIDEYKSGDL